MKKDIFNYLKDWVDSAINSNSLPLLYECYGEVKMARKLSAITIEQYWKLTKSLVRSGINNQVYGLE